MNEFCGTVCICRFTMEVVQRRRAQISQQEESETAPKRKKDFVDIILLTKVGGKKLINGFNGQKRH